MKIIKSRSEWNRKKSQYKPPISGKKGEVITTDSIDIKSIVRDEGTTLCWQMQNLGEIKFFIEL